MSLLLLYILKLFISLAVVWLFYHFILRKLTFYNHNRWYLLGYSLLSFFIPLVNIAPALQNNELAGNRIIQWIPVIHNSSAEAARGIQLTVWSSVVLVIIGGMIFMLIRLLVQLLSFRKMMRKATLIASQEVNIYQVDGAVIPFSFGNAVFINPSLHTSEELEDIIRHEFVHVKQRHSLDILFSELVCLLNWYNPFAWLIRSAIRQNLEFIADHQVLGNGTNKKQYQYLLLKVIGNSQFSIAPKFNFSSLKKRIAMMNKLQSSKKHLLRFLFLLPVLAFILVSFRKEIGDRLSGRQRTDMPHITTDTIPHPSTLNNKDYQITVKDNKGNCMLVIKDKTGKEIKKMLLTEWNKDAATNEALYGEIPPAPPGKADIPAPPGSSTMQDFLERNAAVKEVGWVYNRDNTAAILHLNMKDGSSQQYDLRNESERKTAENKYGELPLLTLSGDVVEGHPVAPSAPLALIPVEVEGLPLPPVPPAAPNVADLPGHVRSININNGKATVTHKDGKKEHYDLKKTEEKKEFEKKYGAPPAVPPSPSALKTGTTGAPGIFDYDGKKVTVTRANSKKEVYDLNDPVQKTEFLTLYDKPAVSGVQEVVIPDYPRKAAMPLEAVTVADKPIRSGTTPVTNLTLAEIPVKTVKLSDPVLAGAEVESTKMGEVRTTQPLLVDLSLVEVERPVSASTINIGGLGMKNEDQYILVDGKEYKPKPGDKLKGTYRISFMDKKEAIKKYGEKAKNGAIIVETLK